MLPRLLSTLEPLESRIAPATLVSPTVVTYQDLDGDTVTVKVSKPIFKTAADATDILHFSVGGVTDPSATSNATPQQLQTIFFGGHTVVQAAGINITVTAKLSAAGGDGLADVGLISAGGRDLGNIKISGDLGRVVAGDGNAGTPALKSLSVQSLGALGTATQESGGTLASTLVGSLPLLKVKGDVLGTLTISSGGGMGMKSSPMAFALPPVVLGNVTIGGSLMGGATADSGHIDVDGRISNILIKGNVQGGAGSNSGRISASGAISAAVIGGSMIGNGIGSGALVSQSSLGMVKVVRDLRGGGGDDSGQINGAYLIKSVTIGGSMVGAGGEDSGAVIAEEFNGMIKSVKVGRDIIGGDGDDSAYIHAGASLGPVKIGGSVRGGAGDLSALIYGGSAIVAPHFMTSVTIGGDLIGGPGTSSGSLGTAFQAAGQNNDLTVGTIVIKGSVIGAGAQSGAITGGTFGSILIGGNVTGVGDSSGTIIASHGITTLSIGGSLVGGAASSGSIFVASLGALKIGRDLQGGTGTQSGHVSVYNGSLQTALVGGSIISGSGSLAGGLDVAGSLGSLLIGGDVRGTSAAPVVISSEGTPFKSTPLALGKFTLMGSADYLQVLGGYIAGQADPVNADARIGPVLVKGNWRTSSISAGVDAGADNQFGTPDDVIAGAGDTPANLSRIASITIQGRVSGTVGGNDAFGFVAQQIGKIKIGAATFPTLTAAHPVDSLSSTGDVAARLVADAN